MNGQAELQRLKEAEDKLALAAVKIDSLQNSAFGRTLAGASPETIDGLATNISMLRVMVRKQRR